MDEHCGCINVKNGHMHRFEKAYFKTPLFTLFRVLRLFDDNYSLLITKEVLKGIIVPLVVRSWLWQRIQKATTLDRPWVCAKQRGDVVESRVFYSICPPANAYIQFETTYYNHFKSPHENKDTYVVPAYFWCDDIYYTRECPHHRMGYLPAIETVEQEGCVIS